MDEKQYRLLMVELPLSKRSGLESELPEFLLDGIQLKDTDERARVHYIFKTPLTDEQLKQVIPALSKHGVERFSVQEVDEAYEKSIDKRFATLH